MATLTNPVEEQNIVNRFADYVPPAANTGISYGTNSMPFSEMSFAFMGGTTSGRTMQVTGNSIKNNGQLIDASGIQDALEQEVVEFTRIRNLNALLNVTGTGGNTGTRPTAGIITNVTGIAFLNPSYQISLQARSVNLQTGQIVDDAVLEQKFADLRNQYNAARGTTATIQVDVCHASCHSSCHSSRGRR